MELCTLPLPHQPPKLIHIGPVPLTLFSPNVMIIITGTFKPYEITLFLTGLLAYYFIYERAESL